MGYPRQAWHLAFLMRSQWFSPERLAELQNARLQRMVRHAFDNVPFYRRKLIAAGIHPQDIRTSADLRSLPITTKDELREAPATKTSGLYPKVERFRVTQETVEAIDWHIVPAADFSQDDSQRLAALTTECLGSDVRVGVRLASRLPETPSDKRRTVVSHVPRGTDRSRT